MDTMMREIKTIKIVWFIFGNQFYVAKDDYFLYECKVFHFEFRIGI